MTLDHEMAVFQAELPNLLSFKKGQYALVGGNPPTLLGVFLSAAEAIEGGRQKLGPSVAFLVRQITELGSPKYFSRKVRPDPLQPV